MARLGSVLGGIVAELTRARVVADMLTRDIASEYGQDPLLASLSVPRVTLGEATVTVRFTVSDVQEEAPQPIDPKTVGDGWKGVLGARVMPEVLARRQLTAQEQATVLAALEAPTTKARAPANVGTLAGAPPRVVSARFRVADIRKALEGERSTLVESSTRQVVDRWDSIPADIRAKLGGKAVFESEVAAETDTALSSYLDRRIAINEVQAALRSKLEVSVKTEDLPDDPQKVHELRLTLRGDDVEAFVAGPGGL